MADRKNDGAIHVRLPRKDKQKLEMLANENRRSLSEFLRRLFRKHLRRKK